MIQQLVIKTSPFHEFRYCELMCFNEGSLDKFKRHFLYNLWEKGQEINNDVLNVLRYALFTEFLSQPEEQWNRDHGNDK